MIFDCILILFKLPLEKIVPETLYVKKETCRFGTSFKLVDKRCWEEQFFDRSPKFWSGRERFNERRDSRVLFPYVDLGTEEGGEYFTPKVAKSASSAAEGLCILRRR